MLQKWAGYDPSERQIIARSAASRFDDDTVAEIVARARDGQSGPEIARALGLKAQNVRHKLWSLGISLRRPTLKARIRMVINVSRRLRDEAAARGVSVPVLVRRVLDAVSSGDWFDDLLSPVRAHSLGAAATPAAGRAGAAAADAHSVAAASFAVVLLRTPRLSGCCARLG